MFCRQNFELRFNPSLGHLIDPFSKSSCYQSWRLLSYLPSGGVSYLDIWIWRYIIIRLAVLISRQIQSSVFNCSFDHLKAIIKIRVLHESFRYFSVDSNNVFFLLAYLLQIKRYKKRNSIAVVGLGLFCFLGGMLDWKSTQEHLLTVNTCQCNKLLSDLAMSKHVVVLRVAPKAAIPSSEASKRSDGCYLL